MATRKSVGVFKVGENVQLSCRLMTFKKCRHDTFFTKRKLAHAVTMQHMAIGGLKGRPNFDGFICRS